MKTTTAQAIEAALVVGAFYLELVKRGVPEAAALQMSQSYTTTLLMRELMPDPPKQEPWQ